MKLDTVFKICKTSKRFIVLRQNPKTQWLGNDIAIYALENHTNLTPAYLTASASLTPQQVTDTSFKNDEFPDWLDTSDLVENESFVGISEFTINFNGTEYTPIFTTEGARFINSLYLKPFEKEDYELLERHTEDGKLYFVVKLGMFVNAIIMAQDIFLDFATVTQFQRLATQLQLARQEMEKKGEEVNSLDED